MEETAFAEGTARNTAPTSDHPAATAVAWLEAASHVAAATEPGEFAARAAAFAGRILPESRGVLLVRCDGEHRVSWGGEEPTAREHGPPGGADGLLGRAVISKVPVLHDIGEGCAAAVPLLVDSHPIGALFASTSGVSCATVLGPLCALARHIAVCAAIVEKACDQRAFDPASAKGVPESLKDAKLTFERHLLRLRMRTAGGNIAAAARSLRMDRGQLSKLLRKHHLERQDFRGGS